MSGKGNCYDNAMVETFFKTLKSELGLAGPSSTPAKKPTRPLAATSTGFYNPVRRHSALDFTSPAQFEKMPPNEPMPLH